MSDEVATEEPKKPAAKRKPKAKPKAKKEPKKKGARKYNAALAMRVLYTLDAVPEGNKVKVGRKTVVFTKYARKALAETIVATPSDQKADAKALQLLKDMGGEKKRPKQTVEGLIAATERRPMIITVNKGDDALRVPFIKRWFDGRRGPKTVKVRYEKKKVTITLP